MTQPFYKKFLLNFTIALISIFGSFLLIEIGIRVYYKVSNSRTTIKWRDDALVGRRLIPSQSGLFVSNTNEYKTEIKINSKGFRDIEHNTEKPQDVYRILLLGDSFVENFQVPLNKTVFKQMEELLTKSINKKVEVIAMGLGDSGTAQQLLLLKTYGLSYHPDLVVHFFFSGNDVKNNSLQLMGDRYRPYYRIENNELSLVPFKTRTSKPLYSLLSKFKDNSRTLEFILNAKGKLLNTRSKSLPNDYEVYRKNSNKDYEDAWKLTEALILESKKETELTGSKYFLISLANNEEVNKDVQDDLKKRYPEFKSAEFDFNTPDNHLFNFCTTNSVNCAFMLPYFKNYVSANNDITHYPKDGHFNSLGTNLAASFVAEKINDYLISK